MNEQLEITEAIQAAIDQVVNLPLNFAESKKEAHPKFPQYDRYIRVYDIDIKARNEFAVFNYEQILKDKDTGEEISIKLPTPEWVVYKDTWSYLRDKNNTYITLPLKEGSTSTETKVRVPSFKYMLWMLKNNKAPFIMLIQNYLDLFIASKIADLNTTL